MEGGKVVWQLYLNDVNSDLEVKFEGPSKLDEELIREKLEEALGLPVILLGEEPDYTYTRVTEVIRAARKLNSPVFAVIDIDEDGVEHGIGLYLPVNGAWIGDGDAALVELF